jgi:hypothetical protein
MRVQQTMEKHGGNYIPTGLHMKQKLRFSIYNVDAHVDTSDGRISFHTTAISVCQRGSAFATHD